MTSYRAGAAVLAAAVALTACTSGGTKTTKRAKKKGGQLVVLMGRDVPHLDPQRLGTAAGLDLGRLLFRTLTTFDGTHLVPDLATDLGTPSDGARTWTFHLRAGLTYEDGTAITAQDVKHAVERSMNPQLTGGPTQARQDLAGAATYAGPYGGEDLAAVQTPDPTTIVFRLGAPHGDFPTTVSLPTFSPVPQAKDTRTRYDDHPLADGPYRIASYVPGSSLLLSRNPHWGQDPVRKPLPDTVTVQMGLDQATIDRRLISPRGTDTNAVQLGSGVALATLPTIRGDRALRSRALSGPTGRTRSLAMNTRRGPTRELKVRQALQYAVSRAAQAALTSGDPSSTILAPNVPGHQDFDAYPTLAAGDPTTARELLSAAGYPSGFHATVLATTALGEAQATDFQIDMRAINVDVTVRTVDAGTFDATAGDPRSEPEFVVTSQAPTWLAAGTVLGPLFDGREISPRGNRNLSQLDVPEVDAALDRISAMTDQGDAAKAWGDLDEALMTGYAPVLPLLADTATFLVGPNVTGASVQAVYGQPDLLRLGIR